MRSITLPALRRLVLGAQGYAGRTRRGTVPDVERTIRRLTCVQLDSISTVERSQEAETLRALALRAVRGRGALTESGIVEHWRLRRRAPRIRPHVEALVAEGLLERIRVADGGAPVLVAAGTELDQPRPSTSVLLSFHRESGVRRSAAPDNAFDRPLDRLRALAGLETVER